ncbi:MAG: PQQ-dependent sugar dehydrogenase [Bdellovibrionota bacterium]
MNKPRSCLALGLVLTLSFFGCTHEPPPATVRLEPVVTGLEQPVLLTHAGDQSGRLFAVEKPGRVRIIAGGKLLDKAFLDIHDLVSKGQEQGLLGLAFHPDFKTNGRAFVNYTNVKGNTVIAEYRVQAHQPDELDPASARTILTFDQPYENHNGGNLAFGPDGYLYIGTGDGGNAGDPHRNGQSLQTLLGKMLRIDMAEGAQPYRSPSDNPFADRKDARPEIWAYGLRNPWRYSFDSKTGRLFVGDVGQDRFEEVDIVRRGGNYGWSTMEAGHCFRPENCDVAGIEQPIHEYGRSDGTCVTGGYVYHGALLPDVVGKYVFGDFGYGTIWTLTEESNGSWKRDLLLRKPGTIASFGIDEAGEIYVVDISGSIDKLLPVKSDSSH